MLKIPCDSAVAAGGHSGTKLLISRLEDLDEEKDPSMDVIANGIINGADFWLP
jgi:hypothetical protein